MQNTLFPIPEKEPERKRISIDKYDQWTEIKLFLEYPIGKGNPNGDPVAKQSVRSKIMPKGKNLGVRGKNGELYYKLSDLRVSHYQPAYLEHVKKILKEQIYLLTNNKISKPFENEVHVLQLCFYFSPLKSFSNRKIEEIKAGLIVRKTTKPDMMDNLSKILFDSLSGIVFKDDGCISYAQEVEKLYSTTPGVFVKLLCK